MGNYYYNDDINQIEFRYNIRNAAWAKLDENGMIQDACSSPFFDRPGSSTEAQAFFLMMERAYKQLKEVLYKL
ncbi:MAG: hypothetical protein R6W78_18105 [Bacteroidales bacterium]